MKNLRGVFFPNEEYDNPNYPSGRGFVETNEAKLPIVFFKVTSKNGKVYHEFRIDDKKLKELLHD